MFDCEVSDNKERQNALPVCIVVGSGVCGSVIARRLAEECDKKVMVLERRQQVSGNMYDEYDENGLLIQKYGPHVFHTSKEAVNGFVNRFSKMDDYTFRCSAEIDGIMVPSPFNFKTVDLLYPAEKAEAIKAACNEAYPGRDAVPILEMLRCENLLVKEYAQMLFEKDYMPYTCKQWDLRPDQMDVSVLNRVQVMLSYRDTYFNDTYESMPAEGYTKMFLNMLDHPNITVRLNTDALDELEVLPEQGQVLYQGQPVSCPVVYTGALDELFGYRFGHLPYRALWFEYKRLDQERYIKETPIAVYPMRPGYTRITEYKTFLRQEDKAKGFTVIALEYPLEYDKDSEKANEPSYPVVNQQNMDLYAKYTGLAAKVANLFPCGRLGDYKYYNMDDVIDRAFQVYETVKGYMEER